MCDWCPGAYFILLKTVAVVFVVLVAADVADRSCEEQQRMIDRVLCISRKTTTPLCPVLSPAGSFCAVILILDDCNLCILLDAAIPRFAGPLQGKDYWRA
jgi:hypothetical protein